MPNKDTVAHQNEEHLDFLKKYSFEEELTQAIKAIDGALAILQNNRSVDPPLFLFLLLMSTGLERLLKLVWIIHSHSTGDNKLPRHSDVKSIRHNVNKLKTKIVEIGYTNWVRNTPDIIEKDKSFLKDSQLLAALLNLVTEFGNNDRYLYLDEVLRSKTTLAITSNELLMTRWENIEALAFPIDYQAIHDKPDSLEKVLACQKLEIVRTIEKFIRAMGRTVFFGERNSRLRSSCSGLIRYLMIDDENLGQKKYDIYE